MKKILILVSIIILALTGIRFGMTKYSENMRSKQLELSKITPVELKEVEEIDMYKSIEIPGRVQSQDKIDLVARIDGYLQKKHFKEGDYVTKGQVLFTIEPTQYLNNLNKAKADLENAKALLEKTTKDYDRGTELVKKDFISKSTYDSLKADKASAMAQVKSASAMLAEAKRNYGYTKITAPVSGKIGSLQIQEGNYVAPSSGTLATITKIDPIYVKYSVDSKQFDELRNSNFLPQKGSNHVKVDVILTSGETYPYKGVQDFLDNQISMSTGTIDLRATFKNDSGTLIPGDFVKVKVYSNDKTRVTVIPQEMVLQDTKGKYVFVAAQDNTAQAQYFKDGGQYGKYWIVKEGLNPKDKYISTNITKLMPKAPIKVIEAAQQADTKEN